MLCDEKMFYMCNVQEAAGYQPQVEAISPTPEDRPAERDDIKSTKDDLLQKISKVDREIAKAESQIAKLKKKQARLLNFLLPLFLFFLFCPLVPPFSLLCYLDFSVAFFLSLSFH